MTSRREALKSAALLPLAALTLPSWAAPRLGAPIVAGHFTHDTVRLWMRASEPGEVMLRYAPPGAEARRSQAVRFAMEDGLCATLQLTGLSPATAYSCEFEGTSATFRTAPAPGAAPRDFRVYMGSCAYTETHTRNGNEGGSNHHIFDTMAGRMAGDKLPHFMLWLGDNLYLRNAGGGQAADYSSVAAMEARYAEVRSKPMLQKLFAATHHYAIWDDHDYGPNNSDRTFPLKDHSLRLFRRYWPNPDMGSAALPGTWARFTQEDAEFFLLDDRYYRDNEKAPPDPAKAMFGEAQMAWLRSSLADSKATFKLVAGGSQFLSEAPNGVHSGWHSYPGERGAFLAWLGKSRIPGVVLLSGDTHNTQFFRHAIEGAADVCEFSCSPLTSKVTRLRAGDWRNPRLDKACVVEAQNYGTLEFSGSGRQRRVTAACFDPDGKPLWSRVVATAS